MTLVHIRPFTATDHDYAAIVALHKAIWPDRPDTVAICLHMALFWEISLTLASAGSTER